MGGIAGAAAGGVGAVPGAIAGATSGLALAAEVGYGLLVATLIIEGASILKASYNLTRSDRTPIERECDCELIASSGLTVGICGAMAILGSLAARFAKAIYQSVANRLFAGPRTVQRTTARGRVVEARVTLGELISSRFRARAVTVTDRLTPGGLLGESGNFPRIDLARNAQVTIRSQGQPITDTAGLRAAMRNNQPINVDVNGGTVISIRSRGGQNVSRSLQGDINQLANVGPPDDGPQFHTRLVIARDGDDYQSDRSSSGRCLRARQLDACTAYGPAKPCKSARRYIAIDGRYPAQSDRGDDH